MTRPNVKTLAFQPRAGTKAHLAIWHMINNAPPGERFSAEELAIAMECDTKGVLQNLRAAVAAGVITKHPGRSHGQRCWLYAIHPQWTLTTPPPDHAARATTTASQSHNTKKRIRPAGAPDAGPDEDNTKDPWPRQRCISTTGHVRMERIGTVKQVFEDSTKRTAQTQEQQA